MEIEVIKQNGESTTRKVKLSEEVFGIEPNDHVIWLDVKNHLANARQGTHKSKQRAEIKGSSRKIKKQKGTGGARAGNIKNPLFKGGGRVFGPAPRDYSFKLNKKEKDLARKSALSYKAKENSISVVEDFDFEAPKTKQYLAILKAMGVDSQKTLVILPKSSLNISKSSNNLQNSKVILADQINTYDVIHADKLVFLESSLEKINCK